MFRPNRSHRIYSTDPHVKSIRVAVILLWTVSTVSDRVETVEVPKKRVLWYSCWASTSERLFTLTIFTNTNIDLYDISLYNLPRQSLIFIEYTQAE